MKVSCWSGNINPGENFIKSTYLHFILNRKYLSYFYLDETPLPHYEPAIAHVAAAAWEVWLDIEAARHAMRYSRPEPGGQILRK